MSLGETSGTVRGMAETRADPIREAGCREMNVLAHVATHNPNRVITMLILTGASSERHIDSRHVAAMWSENPLDTEVR